jgi:hypothetical protein
MRSGSLCSRVRGRFVPSPGNGHGSLSPAGPFECDRFGAVANLDGPVDRFQPTVDSRRRTRTRRHHRLRRHRALALYAGRAGFLPFVAPAREEFRVLAVELLERLLGAQDQPLPGRAARGSRPAGGRSVLLRRWLVTALACFITEPQ